jgi:type IV secretory pathway VirB10-like protein
MNTNQPTGRNKEIPAVSITLRYGRALAVLSLLLMAATACGNGQAASSSVMAIKASAASAAPSPSALALTPCDTAEEQTSQAAVSFICTEDAGGQLVWFEASASKAITDKRAADVAAKAATAKAAAKAAAEKAAAEKAAKRAAQRAAAKKAADAAIAAQAAQSAAEAKAAQDAAAAKAAADQAAADQAAQQALVAPPAPAPAPSNCDPNYSGACVPIASDVDCAGGNGNGPAYVQGPVTVTGSDIYRLDGNSDGVGCEG